MPRAANRQAPPRAVFLMALSALVHAMCWTTVLAQKSQPSASAGVAGKAAPKKQALEILRDVAGLPAPVLEMREAILSAVKSGRIEDLQTAIEMNEIKPAFTDGPVPDPVAYLKTQSGDGEGKDVLAALGVILEAGFVAIPLGRDLENNRIYVWPYFAEVGLDSLTPEQQAELARIVPEQSAREMRERGIYAFWRIAIAADGTWHSLTR